MPSFGRQLDRNGAAQFGDALAHRCDPHTGAVVRPETDPIVHDFNADLVVYAEADPAVTGMGMALDVGQGLHHDAIGGDFDGGGKGRHLVGGVHADLETTGRGLPGLFLNGRKHPQLIESRGSQVVDHPPDIGDDHEDQFAQLVELLLGCREVLLDEVPHRAGLQAERCQGRSDGVMQVAPKTATFLLARQDQTLASQLQIVFQAHHLGCRPCSAGDHRQETSLLAGRQVVVGWDDEELSDHFGHVEHGERQRRGRISSGAVPRRPDRS